MLVDVELAYYLMNLLILLREETENYCFLNQLYSSLGIFIQYFVFSSRQKSNSTFVESI